MAGTGRRRGTRKNWGGRVVALMGSVAAFVGFWQMAAQMPHPVSALNTTQATPTDSYTVPTGQDGNPIPLPKAPHSSTGLSH